MTTPITTMPTKPDISTEPAARRWRRPAAAVALVAGVLSACGATPLALDDLDPATQNLVLFESGWQCELGRFAVDDPAALEGMRLTLQANHEITEGAYNAFLADLAADDELRDLIAARTSACLDSGDPIRL